MILIQKALFLVLFCHIQWGLADTIRVVTEESFPYHYSSGQKIVGNVVRLVDAVLKRADLEYEMDIFPWARAYHMSLNQPNVMIFSIVRTKEREKLFKWVGEVMPIKYALIRLKTRVDITPQNLQQAENYCVSVMRNDVVHQYLRKLKFKDLYPINRLEQGFKMLMAGHVDLIPYNLTELLNKCRDMKIDCDLFEPVVNIDDISTGMYMAFSHQTDDSIVKRAVNAYNQIKNSGEFDRIMKQK